MENLDAKIKETIKELEEIRKKENKTFNNGKEK